MTGQDAGQDVLARMRELDRRKLGAARKAKAARDAEQREAWRKSKQRQRAMAKQVRNGAANQRETPIPGQTGQKDKRFQELFGDNAPEPKRITDNAIRRDLVALTRDTRAPASARVTALRTLAEMDGHIGRLQDRSGDTVDRPLSELSRDQLLAELDRLRAIVAQDAG